MPGNKQIAISSIKEFLKYLDLNPDETPQPAYRGEPGTFETACTPSLFRSKRKKLINCEEEIAGYLFEKRRVDTWFNEVTLLELKNPYSFKYEIEKLILAQHYGIKTRLLDWTTNPLVALWFACKDFENKVSDQSMYAVYEFIPPVFFPEDDGSDELLEYDDDRNLAFNNPYCLNFQIQKMNSFTPFKNIHFIQPIRYLDIRIYKQSSALSIHPNSNKKIEPFKTYIINRTDAKNIMYELNILGVNFNTVGLATRESIAHNVNQSFDNNI